MATQPWFESWFDSPYYHILYKNRSYTEAADFLDQLVHYLSPPEKATMLDIGCGNGRHAIHLANLGYQVTGFDLAANSIAHAIQSASTQQLNNVIFKRWDMRDALGLQFDYVFNLFSSFGYFDKEEDNLKVIKAMHHSLNKQGIAVIDFLNAAHVKAKLVETESKIVDNLTFKINRKIVDERVIKQIEFKADGSNYQFEEKVQLLSLTDFEHYFNKTGLQVASLFGNYQLAPFELEKSDRLIMVVKHLV